MIGTSVRAEHPDWSVERIFAMVQNMALSDVTFLDGDEELAEAMLPPASNGSGQTGEKSGSPSNSTSSDPTEQETYETFSATQG
jgi:hypothetical protein